MNKSSTHAHLILIHTPRARASNIQPPFVIPPLSRRAAEPSCSPSIRAAHPSAGRPGELKLNLTWAASPSFRTIAHKSGTTSADGTAGHGRGQGAGPHKGRLFHLHAYKSQRRWILGGAFVILLERTLTARPPLVGCWFVETSILLRLSKTETKRGKCEGKCSLFFSSCFLGKFCRHTLGLEMQQKAS